MAKKKKRVRNITVYGSIEGTKTEIKFFNHLIHIYKPEDANIKVQPETTSGGNPNSILSKALKQCYRNKTFSWFDEDFEFKFPLNKESREILMSESYWNIKSEDKKAFMKCPMKDLQEKFNPLRRNPVLIVSNPVSVESLIFKTLNLPLPIKELEEGREEEQVDKLKNKLKQILNKYYKEDFDKEKFSKEQLEEEFYKENLSKEILEERRKSIPELDLLIYLITK